MDSTKKILYNQIYESTAYLHKFSTEYNNLTIKFEVYQKQLLNKFDEYYIDDNWNKQVLSKALMEVTSNFVENSYNIYFDNFTDIHYKENIMFNVINAKFYPQPSPLDISLYYMLYNSFGKLRDNFDMLTIISENNIESQNKDFSEILAILNIVIYVFFLILITYKFIIFIKYFQRLVTRYIGNFNIIMSSKNFLKKKTSALEKLFSNFNLDKYNEFKTFKSLLLEQNFKNKKLKELKKDAKNGGNEKVDIKKELKKEKEKEKEIELDIKPEKFERSSIIKKLELTVKVNESKKFLADLSLHSNQSMNNNQTPLITEELISPKSPDTNAFFLIFVSGDLGEISSSVINGV